MSKRINSDIFVVIVVILVLTVSRSSLKKVQAQNVPEIAKEIRAEATRANLDPDGHPLPLAAHWHASNWPLSVQIKQIRQGHHIMPFIEWYTGTDKTISGMKQVNEWRLPLAIIHGNQWLGRFFSREKFTSPSPEEKPLVLTKKGKTIKKISPFGPVQPWEDLGRMLAGEAVIKNTQEQYPNPSLVLLVSNNEASLFHPNRDEIERSGRYLDLYGKGRSDTFKRRVVGDGYSKRYRALFKGIRDGLEKKSWIANSLMVPYGGTPGPPHYGRPDEPIGDGGWRKWSLATPYRLGWEHWAWDGTMGSYYDNDWEKKQTMFNVWSDQTEFMNQVFMKKDALAVNPEYWYEIIYWDGGHDKANQYREKGYSPTTPKRYRGWVQYGMWLLTPRVAREWEGSTAHRSSYWPKMKEIIRAVDLVHADDTLRRFWRNGRLVPNTAEKHPFQSDLIDKFKDESRWFRLSTDLDPERPWKLTTALPVWPLARVMGQKPNREWLVYAFAPLGDKQDVKITIPEYDQTIKVDVSVGGSFYLVSESDGSVTRVGKLSQVNTAPRDP